VNLYLYRLHGVAGVGGDGKDGALNYMRIPYEQALALLRRPCRFVERSVVGGVEQTTYVVGQEPDRDAIAAELLAMLQGLNGRPRR
jgi:hypothetical protein